MRKLLKKAIFSSAIICGILLSQSIFASGTVIGGYWENWKAPLNPTGSDTHSPEYYGNDINNFNHIYYSFLTLAKVPNPDTPAKAQWDGKAIYESMTQDDVLTVMKSTSTSDTDNWQYAKINALIEAVHAKNQKFIWAIGGWSDLTETISEAQIKTLASKCVSLLKIAGDGVDFDWEHLSDDPNISSQQRTTLGKFIVELRKELDVVGMKDKMIGYTTRFNAFAKSPIGPNAYPSDGEGLEVFSSIKAAGSTPDKCLNWVNVMMYDSPAQDMGAKGDKITLADYQNILEMFKKNIPANKIVMGFEPGGQAAGGVWEGMDVDKQVIDYIKDNNFGGIMFWAVNQPALNTSDITGLNAQNLAGYANDKVENKSLSI